MGALGGLLQGMVAGRELRMRLQQEADQHQQLQQTMQQQQQAASMKMITDRLNLEMMGARPVNNGMVDEMLSTGPYDQAPQGGADSSSPSPSTAPLDALRASAEPPSVGAAAPPSNPGAPAIVSGQPVASGNIARKANKGQVVSVPWFGGQSMDYELPTREEQIVRQNQMADMAQVREKMGLQRANALTLAAYGVPTPPEILKAFPGIGPKIYKDDVVPLTEKLAQINQKEAETRNANQEKLGPGDVLKDRSTGATIATGGPVTTGPNGAFESWLPGYYQQNGITNPQPKDKSAAYEKFLKLKPEDTESEVALAQRAARGDKDADAALKRLDQSKLASRPINNFAISMPTGLGGPQNADAQKLTGEEYLKTLPAATAAQIRLIASGGDVMPSANSRNPGAGALRQAVMQFDPDYTPLLGQQRRETLKEFTNTSANKAGGQSLALNTLIHHADLYMQTAEALKNGTFKPGNAVYNAVATAFGKAPPTQANLVARFFAGETGKVATGGVPAEGEINGILKSLGNEGSPEQMYGAGNSLLQIAAGRMQPLQERVNDAKLQPYVHVLGPDAKEILERHGFDSATMKPRMPGGPAGGRGGNGGALSLTYQGHVFTFPDQATMTQFKKDQGIQ